MKNIKLIATIATTAVLVLFIITILLISFLHAKPTTDTINIIIEAKMDQLVYIPKDFTRPAKFFEVTQYAWEMETRDNEVVAVEFSYTPSFKKNDQKIFATLKMLPGGDPSVFSKVFPALIKDEQSLYAAHHAADEYDPDNEEIGYKNLRFEVKESTKQAITMIWEFNKQEISQELTNEYHRLEVYPSSLLRIFYRIPQYIVRVLSAS